MEITRPKRRAASGRADGSANSSTSVSNFGDEAYSAAPKQAPLTRQYNVNGVLYTIDKSLGSGTEGDVYRAIKEDGTVVALKEYHGEPDETLIGRMETELKLRGAIPSTKGIPGVIDFGISIDDVRPRLVLVTDLIEGNSLENIMRDGWRPREQEIKEVVRESATLLNHFHERRIIHRDVSPKNVVRMNDGSVAFPDLGCIRDAHLGTFGATFAVGALAYSAPESVEGDPKFSSDIYSLGRVAYRLMAGREPSTPPLSDLYKQDIDFRELKRLGYDNGLLSIVEKMCAKRAEDRYQSVAELLTDLDAGKVTVKAIVRKEEQVEEKQKRSRMRRFYDWIKYFKQTSSAPEGDVIVYDRIFGNGLKILIQDASGNPLYCSKNRRLENYYSISDDGKINNVLSFDLMKPIKIAGKNYYLFTQEDKKFVLVSRDGDVFGEPFEMEYTIENRLRVCDENEKFVKLDSSNFETPSDLSERRSRDTQHEKYERVQQYMGKQGLIGIPGKEVRTWGDEGWTVVGHADYDLLQLVKPDGTIYLGTKNRLKDIGSKIELDGIVYIQATDKDGKSVLLDKDENPLGGRRVMAFAEPFKDSKGRSYIAFVEQEEGWETRKCGVLDGSGNLFGSLEELTNEESLERSINGMVEFGGKVYLHKMHYVSSEPAPPDLAKNGVLGIVKFKHSFTTRDGKRLGNTLWDRIRILQGEKEEYAVCECDGDKPMACIFDKDENYAFGGPQLKYAWHSKTKRGDEVCMDGGIDSKVSVYSTEGAKLYEPQLIMYNKVRQLNAISTSNNIVEISEKVLEFEEYNVRTAVVKEECEPLIHNQSTYINYYKINYVLTEQGIPLASINCQAGRIGSIGKTPDGRLTVTYTNVNGVVTRTEIIDVKQRIEEMQRIRDTNLVKRNEIYITDKLDK